MNLFERIFETYKYDLFKKKNVIGVGIGYKFKLNQRTDRLGIITLVAKKIPKALLASRDCVPSNIKGLITDVWETGPISNYQVRQGVLRPAQPGCSISHYQSPGTGTFGAVVKDIKGQSMILSNNHILANLTNGADKRSKVGDPIVQPGILDGGTEKERIAFLKKYIPLNYGNSETNPQLVDVALAQPDKPNLINKKVLNIGLIKGSSEPRLGQSVFKSGRSSGLTVGEVIAKKVLLAINYGEQLNVNVIFDDQFLATTSALPGDSGSLLISTEEKKAVGLLLGGGSGIDVYNKITTIMNILRITI